MANKEIDVRNLNDEELLDVYGSIAQKTVMVHDRLKELFDSEETLDEIDKEKLLEEDLSDLKKDEKKEG